MKELFSKLVLLRVMKKSDKNDLLKISEVFGTS